MYISDLIQQEKDVLFNLSPEMEAEIAADAESSYWYAKNIIKGRWKPGEAAIATSHIWSYWYSARVVRGRWEPGEVAITGRRYFCKYYIEMVLKSDKKYKTDPDFMAFLLANG